MKKIASGIAITVLSACIIGWVGWASAAIIDSKTVFTTLEKIEMMLRNSSERLKRIEDVLIRGN